MWSGAIKEIFIGGEGSTPLTPRESVEAVAGKGLVGDRYYDGVGFYSFHPGPIRELSLIESEVLHELVVGHDLELVPGEHRRNLVTSGVPLGHLLRRRFRIGETVAEGLEIAEPCKHLVEVTGRRKILSALIHRGGLHAAIIEGGTISIGDSVEPL